MFEYSKGVPFHVFRPRAEKFRDHTRKLHPEIAFEKGWITEAQLQEKMSRPRRVSRGSFKPCKILEQRLIQEASQNNSLDPKKEHSVKAKPQQKPPRTSRTVVFRQSTSQPGGDDRTLYFTMQEQVNIEKVSQSPPNVMKFETVPITSSIEGEQTVEVEISTSEENENIIARRVIQDEPFIPPQADIQHRRLAHPSDVIFEPQTITQIVAQPGTSFQQIPHTSAAPGGQTVTNPSYPVLAGSGSAPQEVYQYFTYDTATGQIQSGN